MIVRLLFLLVLLASPALGQAQTPEAPTRLEPIVVTPSRLEQQAGEAPASVTVITADDVWSAPYITLDDLLRRILSFSLFRRSSSLVGHPTTQGVSPRGVADVFLSFENLLNETYAVPRTSDGIVTIGIPRLVRDFRLTY